MHLELRAIFIKRSLILSSDQMSDHSMIQCISITVSHWWRVGTDWQNKQKWLLCVFHRRWWWCWDHVRRCGQWAGRKYDSSGRRWSGSEAASNDMQYGVSWR